MDILWNGKSFVYGRPLYKRSSTVICEIFLAILNKLANELCMKCDSDFVKGYKHKRLTKYSEARAKTVVVSHKRRRTIEQFDPISTRVINNALDQTV